MITLLVKNLSDWQLSSCKSHILKRILHRYRDASLLWGSLRDLCTWEARTSPFLIHSHLRPISYGIHRRSGWSPSRTIGQSRSRTCTWILCSQCHVLRSWQFLTQCSRRSIYCTRAPQAWIPYSRLLRVDPDRRIPSCHQSRVTCTCSIDNRRKNELRILKACRNTHNWGPTFSYACLILRICLAQLPSSSHLPQSW